jgi:hypothetical protein
MSTEPAQPISPHPFELRDHVYDFLHVSATYMNLDLDCLSMEARGSREVFSDVGRNDQEVCHATDNLSS